jgi:O-antigen ligase
MFGDVNDYGTFIVCALPLMVPLLTLCKKYWHYLFVLGYVLLTMRSMILTGSRTAMIMTVTLFTLPVLLSQYRFRIIPIILIALPLGWILMPESLQNRYRTIWDPTINESANQNMVGRTVGFYIGMENWANHPIIGAGPGCHRLATGMPFEAHNLPGQLAGETGTLGIAAFLFMLSCFGINHYHNWQNYKYLQEKRLGKEGLFCWRVSIAVMYCVFMVLLQGFGLHNTYRFPWVWFGAFQALATMLMQEKVNAVMKGTLIPGLPEMPIRKR